MLKYLIARRRYRNSQVREILFNCSSKEEVEKVLSSLSTKDYLWIKNRVNYLLSFKQIEDDKKDLRDYRKGTTRKQRKHAIDLLDCYMSLD